MKKHLLIFFIFTFSIVTNAQFTKLIDFNYNTDGDKPWGSLISDGTFLYGMTSFGGQYGGGLIFKIMPDGTSYSEILGFDGVNSGSDPRGALIFDGTFLYGMTKAGGANDMGVIFRVKPDGTGFLKLLDFAGTSNGSEPYGDLFFDGSFLYGMTYNGGANNDGVIFKIMPDGTGYVKLHDFLGMNGSNPNGSLISDGTFLYGMTMHGGGPLIGTLFKIMPDGSGYSVLFDFTGGSGGGPLGSLFYDGTFLYGMTTIGGANGDGTIFKVMPNGTGYVNLLDFAGMTNGSNPVFNSLISDGIFLYGMTTYGGTNDEGTLFKIMPDGTGYSKMIDFNGTTNGSYPDGSLYSDGTFLYGMTWAGGIYGDGILFKFQEYPAGIESNAPENVISIYPNPATDGNVLLAFNLKKDDNVKVELFASEGKLVFTKSFFCSANSHLELPINLDEISATAGMYILQVSTSDAIVRKKLIVTQK